MKILVIGETCRDVFTYGICTRLSPESPVPVFNPIETITNDGMAKNVHSNILSLDVDCHLVTNPSWQDITKTRFIEKRSNHMFLRVDKNDSNYGRINLKNINFKEYDIVVISDYDKGFVTEEDIEAISRLHTVTFLDTKKKLGNWCKNIKFIKINNFEYDKTKDSLTSQLKDKMIITLGGGGAQYQGKIFPVDKVEVKDVAGAGDTFIAGLVVKYSETQSIADSIDFANQCATLAVQKRGVSIVGGKNEVH
jgi:D-beta-D-heptose 7-phosphate kinase/D-beta-D-heptose 1-phosphate adenosyltransferase